MENRIRCLKWWKSLTAEQKEEKINQWKADTIYAEWSNNLIQASSSMIERVWEHEQIMLQIKNK